MKGERAEVRYKCECWLPKTSRWFGQNRIKYFTRRFDTEADALAYIMNDYLKLTEPIEVPMQYFGYSSWKLHELKLISWDDAGNKTIECRSLE